MKKSLKTVLSLILTAAMLLTVMLPAFAATGKAADAKVRFNFEKIDNGPDALRTGKMDTADTQMLPKGDVRVSIVLNDKGTIEQGYSTAGIAANRAAMSYRAQLLAKQNALAAQISREILGGKALDVKWNITLAANIISANVPSTAIARIARLDGVKKVVLEQQYEPAVAEKGDAEPNMATSTYMTKAQYVWANGYTGAGSKVAIIDTGIDTDHKSFDADAFDYAISQADADVDLLTAAEVAAIYGSLNIAQAVPANDAVYVSSKIPFAVNYVDEDLDVTHDNDKQGEHGSHVAGIAAANRFIKEADGTYSNAIESVQTQGAAPDAQLIVMKVFGKGGGAYDSDYMVAIEDAVMLGADAVNLSLGSAAAGYVAADTDTYEEILNNLENSDTVVTISAGNAGAWADQTQYGVLFGDDVYYDTVGSPGSYKNAFTAASVENDGSTGPYIVAGDQILFYTETYDYTNKPLVTIAGEHEFVYIDTPGREEEFAGVADILEGKIGICNRGSTSFYQKGNAAVENGAIATVIANNQAGTISMNLTGYLYPAPCVSITQADGAYLKSIATGTGSFECDYYDEDDDAVYHETVTYYTGTLTVSSDALINEVGDVEYHTMSSFSSFGVPGDLSLKPEITTPGGNIYSVNGLVPGGQSYESMSGTSMAAPHLAGLTALLMQYIRENDLTAKTGLTARQLAQSLLMSTAEPMLDADGYYYPVFQQGAGLADVSAAMNAKSYVWMDDSCASASDGKVKAELGDDPDRTGKYDVSFTLNNFTDEDVDYELDYDVFTQYFMYQGLVRDITTDFVYGANVTWTVNGEDITGTELPDYDFNKDGLVNAADAVCLLDYLVGNVAAEDIDLTNADVDKDEDVDTYDAYEALKAINSVIVNAPAGGKVEITAHIDLGPYMYDYYDYNGNYVEAYLYAVEVDSNDGAIGAVHSIPVLGFYGGWTESGMTDKLDYLDYIYSDYALGLDDYEPYYYLSYNQAFLVRYAGESGAYAFGGNPAVYDEKYLPERNAINGENGDAILGRQDTLIRNIVGWRYTVTDKDGNDLIAPVYGGAKYGAYYYASQQKWMNTSTQVGTKYVPSGLAEGDTVTYTVTYAPEYYVQADGSIDWDALGEGASKSITAVIDNTAPELIDAAVSGYDPETYDWTDLTITAKDNQYIAAIVVYNDEGDILGICYPDYEAKAGEEMTYVLNHEELQELGFDPQTKLFVQVYDYAANITNYKMNLDVEDLGSELTITLPEYLVLVRGNSQKVDAVVEPWGVDETLIWRSMNPAIATVDQNGVVTGVADGQTVIVAFSAVDTSVYSYFPVLVKSISKDLNGVVWDEHGEVWFSEFNTSELPAYTKLTESSANAPIASLAYSADGTLYGASFDSDEWLSDLYVVDPETFALTSIGGSDEIAYMDIATETAFGGYFLFGVYGPYVLIVDLETGDYYGYFDFTEETGGNYFVGIALAQSMPGMDVYFLVDEAGELYEIGFGPYNNSFGSTPLYDDGNLGYATDTPYFNSLYFDGESLFWSRFSNEDSRVDIIDADLSETGEIFNLGSFDPDVWPVGGLIELEPADTASGNSVYNAELIGSLGAAELLTELEPLTAVKVASKGTLHTETPADPADPAALNVEDAFTQNVEIKAIDVATNGMVTVKYDASKYTLDSVKSAATHYVINDDGEGELVFAYINREGKTFDKDAVVATLSFASVDQTDGEYTVTTDEINNEHPADASQDITVSNEHVYGEPEWVWTQTDAGVKATAVFTCASHANCVLEVVADLEPTVTTALSCTDDEITSFAATATLDGNTYTDTKEFKTADKLGHDYVAAEVPSTWTVKGGAAEKCSRCGDTRNLVGTLDTKLHVAMTAANNWAAEKGLDAFITGSDTNGEDNTAVIALNVDGIWANVDLSGDVFDGFMTAFGQAVTTYFGTDDVTINGQEVYKNGKFQNTAVKNALFDIGAGFFYKIANLGDDGIYGVYDVTVDGEAIELTVKFTGSEEHIAKIKSFAATIADHISAEVVNGDLVIDVIAPDKLIATVAETYQGDKPVAEALKGVTVGAGLNILATKDADSVFGSQVSAVNKLCAFICKLSPLANKVLGKLTEATVTLADGTKANLVDSAFSPRSGSYKDFMRAVIGMLDDGLLAKTVGDFTEADGVYTIPVNVAVDMTNLGLMAGNTIRETVIINLHLFDNCKHPEIIQLKGKEATCTEDGITDGSYCRICGEVFASQETIPAPGHDLTFHEATVTCTKAGTVAYYECSVCGKYFADEDATAELTAEELNSDALGHDWDDGTVVKAPTCTDGGVLLLTCKNDPNHTKTEFIPALGYHTIGALVPAADPTCTEDGNVDYYPCSVCGRNYADPYGLTEIEDVVIPATGHTMTKIEATVTCTEDGMIEHYKCSVCGKTYADEAGETELTAEELLCEKLGHSWDEGTVLKDATCTEDGLKIYICANDETHSKFEVIEATGHDYKFDSFIWAEDGTTAQVKLICANDETHVSYADAEITSAVTAATCEADAYTVYTATYGDNTETNTVTDEGSALGHDFDDGIEANVTVVEATCTEAGSKTVKCSRCDETQVTEIAAKGHKMTKTAAVKATCTEDGNVEYYTCSVCGKIFADAEGKTELTDTVDKAAGHKLVKTDLKPATCTEDGNVAYYTCSVCGKTFADAKGKTEIKDTVTPATGHKLEKVEAAEATEEKEGNIAYYKCSECGKIFADAEGKTELAPADVVIPKLDGVRKGDVDLNKEITANDARAALRIAVKLDTFAPDSKEFRAADIDDDGNVKSDEARAILRVAVKLDDPDWAAWTKGE